MKKVLIGLVLLVLLAAVGVFVFQEPLKEVAIEQMTKDMFVAEDGDDFDPGLAVDQPFPSIRASMDDLEITDIAQYAGPNGLVFVANRSVDW